MDASTSILGATEIFQPLTLRLKLAYGVGHVLNDLCASMWFTYLLVYFHLVLDYSNKLAGVILLIGQIADGISTPFVGLESDKVDNFWLCRYGRRKTWHLIGTVCVIFSFPFLFIQCIGCANAHQWAQVFYYSSFVIIFQFGWASVQISHLSLIPDLTYDTHERTELNAIRYAFTVLSNICVYGITWAILGISSDYSESDTVGPEDTIKFRNIVLIVVGIGTVFSIIFHFGTKENNAVIFHESISRYSASVGSEKIFMYWKDWLKEIQFYQVAALYMSTRLFVNLAQVYIPLFLQDTLKLHQSSIAIIPLVMYISGFVSSFFMKMLNKSAGRKITYFCGSVIGLGACIWMYFGRGDSFRYKELYFVVVLMGIGGSTMLITSLSITNDLIGSNTESGAFVLGAMSLTDKLSNGIAVLLIQYFHPCRDCCAECMYYYRYVLSCGCGGAAVLAILMLLTLVPATIGERKRDVLIMPENLPDQCSPLLKYSINSDKTHMGDSYSVKRNEE